MATYSIYAKDNPADAVFVREGFSWTAAVFNFLWACWNRMWVVAVIGLCFVLAANALPTELESLVSIAITLIFGVFAGDLMEWSLRRRGFSNIGIVEAHDLESAEAQFYMGARDLPRAPISSHDMLGLFGTP